MFQLLSDGVVKCRAKRGGGLCGAFVFQLLSDGVVKCRFIVPATATFLSCMFQLLSDGVVKCRAHGSVCHCPCG